MESVELVDLSLLSKVIEALKQSMPEDCADVLDAYYKKLVRDIMDMGLEKALEKWLGEEDVIIEDSP